MSDLEKLILLYPDKDWDWKSLSSNPKISWEFIRNNINFSWDWRYVSKNYSISFEIILNNIDRFSWDWSVLSWREDLTIDIVKLYPDKDWNWFGISNVKDININFVKLYPDKNWNWFNISKRISLQDFENNINIAWDDDGLSMNKNITPEIVEKYPHIDWVSNC